MLKQMFANTTGKSIQKALAIIGVIMSIIAVFIIAPIGLTQGVQAAAAPVSINMIYYGWLNNTVAQSIIDTHPTYMVANSPAGPWKGNANINQFMSAGIKYFEYIDGGYEGRVAMAIPNDLQSNLGYITAAANAGAYGIFVDEVSDGIYTTANYSYLQQIADKAHSLGLKVVFNAGMPNWTDQLMNYCDFVSSSETWSNTPLTASQSKWASRTWLLTYGINDATTAANLTIGAWTKGINAQYTCNSYSALPTWFDSYVAQIKTYSIPLVAPTVTSAIASAVTTTSATLNGNLANIGTASIVSVNFQWGLTASYGSTTTTQLPTTTGNLNAALNGLTPGTTYHYRVTASGDGSTNGADQVFTTNVLVLPTISSSTMSDITTTGATLNGNLANMGTASGVSVNFQWGLTSAYGNTSAILLKTTIGSFNTALIGLTPGTTYHYRIVASGDGTVTGTDQSFTTNSATPPAAGNGNTTAIIASNPAMSGGANEYNLFIKVTSSTVASITVNAQVWCAATTTDFPNLLAIGTSLTGNLDHSLGYWRLLKTSSTPATVIVTGNTTGKVFSNPAASGGANEYNLYITVTNSTVSGITVNMQVWCAATTTDFPNLLTVGAILTGNLDYSRGYWRLVKAQ
jgi:hypothetical protein